MSTVAAEQPLFGRIAQEATQESALWAQALRPLDEREEIPIFSSLVVEPSLQLGIETIYEGYLLHYGRPRLFEPTDSDTALLLGDYLYAHGLVHVARDGSVRAVHDLAELISLCAQSRAEGGDGDAAAWAATSAWLGRGGLDESRSALRECGDAGPLLALARSGVGDDDAVDRACAAHARRVR